MLTTEGYRAGAPRLKAALQAFQAESFADDDELRWLWLACHTARTLGDVRAWDELTGRQVALARQLGAFTVLPVALSDRLTVIAKELSISESCLRNWLAQADADAGRSNSSRLTSDEKRELAELRKKARRLEVENEILKRAAAYFARENVLPK